jgi:hypothetical protein
VLYRAGLAHAVLNADEATEDIPKQARALAPGNVVIVGELERVRACRRAKVPKEKAGYGRMFG